MHMADALVSPAVGGAMWAATAATTLYCAKKVREDMDEGKVPLMGILGAFIFAAQMVNFTIPGTGSSGHLGGGLILTILLGPYAAFLVMASVLTVQALFFADGGLLALGANIFNLGFIPAVLAYPVYRVIAGRRATPTRIVTGSLVAAVIGLELGALGVVSQTALSGISALPFSTFAAVMLPIHLAIGIVEGIVTAAVVLFVRKAQPELLEGDAVGRPAGAAGRRPVLVGLAIAAVVAAAALSLVASANPDGLEWSIARVTGGAEVEGPTGAAAHEAAARAQAGTAILPDYGFKGGEGSAAGTSTAGLVGAGITLALAAGLGLALRRRRKASGPKDQ